VDDGRMIFAIPRGRATYIGTTDTSYDGDKDEVITTSEDASYLIHAVNMNFPLASLQLSDIESSWAGLRPLIFEEGKSASELSRKDEIFESPTGLISIAGGKLTGYRKMAERVVNLVVKKHFNDKLLGECKTDEIKLSGSTLNSLKEVKKFTASVTDKLKEFNLPSYVPQYLVENYGQQLVLIFDLWSDRNTKDDADLSLLKAELAFCVKYEMVCSLQDFFSRRTGLINFNIQRVVKWKKEIAQSCKTLLQWDDTKVAQELTSLDRLIESITRFRN
jgi:glycerol-3-phosphate dehydrogenase